MGLQWKSNATKNKGSSNKSSGGTKKRNTKNKNKKNLVKVSEKPEAKQSKVPSALTALDYTFLGAVGLFLKSFSCLFPIISDCDEIYNYWEPTHYLLYGKGFQTWEYSPQYALRSYFYLLLHVTPAYINYNLLSLNRNFMFTFIKYALASFSNCCELYFYSAVYKEFGATVTKMVILFTLFSPGMYIASTAYLPSSFSMYMCFLSTAAWIYKKYELAVFAVAISTYISWPFAALLGLPLALEMLFVKKYYKKFFQWSLLSSAIILPLLIKMDSDLYGRFVVAPLNILMYNVFSSHGPNLYGTEPICYYLINGFLNFNFAFLAAIVAPSVLLLRNYVVAQSKKKDYFTSWFVLSPFYIWFIVFTLQPHKEERFLYPVYPLISLCAAVCIQSIQLIFSSGVFPIFGKAVRRLVNSKLVGQVAMATFVLISFSRIIALYLGHWAPVLTWQELPTSEIENVPINVCLGKEWHRFPSSFIVPSLHWNVRFIQSDFKGQLPAAYSPLDYATTIVHPYFNDMNLEEPSRYFDIEKCHFLIDTDFGKVSELEPNYTAQTDKWTVINSVPILNVEKSAPFFRSFYIPFLSEKFCNFGSYNILQSTKFQLEKKPAFNSSLLF